MSLVERRELVISSHEQDDFWAGAGMYFWDNMSNARYWYDQKKKHGENPSNIKIAKIYLSIFPQNFRTPIMKEIESNKSFYRNFIGQKMAKQVRSIPNLNFYLDTSLDDVERLEKELKGEGDNPIL